MRDPHFEKTDVCGEMLQTASHTCRKPLGHDGDHQWLADQHLGPFYTDYMLVGYIARSLGEQATIELWVCEHCFSAVPQQFLAMHREKCQMRYR